MADYVTKTTMLLLITALLLSVLLSIGDRSQRSAVPFLIPVVIVLPWAVIYVLESALISSIAPEYYEFVWPLMLLAFFLAAPAVRDVCVLVGRIGVATAAASVALGLMGIGSMPYGWHQTDDKAIIGEAALAGPYSHSNILGLAMTLSLPFVLLALRGKERLIGGLVVGVALVWSASRISIVAAVIITCVLVTVKVGRLRPTTRLVTGAWIIAAGAIVIVPLRTTEDAAFTNRGLIWKVTRFYIPEHPLFGWGTTVFEVSDNAFASAIGARAGTAHNMWLTQLAVGGWAAVTATMLALFVIAVRFRRCFPVSSIPALFLLALLLCEIAEDPLRAWRLSPHAFIVWSGLALAVCAFERGSLGAVCEPQNRRAHRQTSQESTSRRQPRFPSD
ncbi:O-antigen ligase family protein [Gordonia sp. KTR9]|uniref:O-antigen ligase family protein n=1 Tax=Gordonia sp. KTR9 TaxID=337191 RepID=UPI00130DABEA|nr:O-antigen ligase family protein [Gordonia sp. KTR9]